MNGPSTSVLHRKAQATAQVKKGLKLLTLISFTGVKRAGQDTAIGLS